MTSDSAPLSGFHYARWLLSSLWLAAALSASAQLTRVANTTLAMPQTPQTFGYTTQAAWSGISFDQPVGIIGAPGETNRIFVIEKTGRIQVINNLSTTPVKSVFLDLSATTLTDGEQGVLGLAFHPNFASNRYFYVFYSTTATTTAGSGRHQRVSRFTALTGTPTNAQLLATEVALISQYDEATNHNGGDIHFGNDGYLYIAVGDEGGGGDGYGNSQRITKDFFAGLLRIDVDSLPGNLTPNTHPAVHAGTYKIPADNPYVGATTFNGVTVNPASIRTEFYAVGLRNPWRFSFDRPTGRLLLGDVGQGAREEIDLIVKGGNYGWSYREGLIAFSGTPPAGVTFIDPIWDAGRSTASSITGGVVYRGTRFAQLFGKYVFGDYGSGRLFILNVPLTGAATLDTSFNQGGIVGFGTDPINGDVLIANIGGSVLRLVYNTTGTGTPIPTTLTATGAFSSLANLTPAAGIVAYTPNVNFWSDFAIKRRWFSVPALADKITFNADGNWTFPNGTVWVKHFDLELTRGNPATARRLETRLLVKNAGGVYGVTYKWNSAQTDATLVAEAGENETIAINDNGTMRNQVWRYPSRAECLQCHTAVGGQALSFNTAQLNGAVTYGATTMNQLTALASAGYFTTTTVPDPTTLRALAPASNTSATLEHRVRSYLAANCISCHQPGGAAQGNWDARIATATDSAGLVGGALVNNLGDAANRVVAVGDTAHSVLLSKISLRGAGQMPPLGSNELDSANIALLTNWINALGTLTISTQPQSAGLATGSSVTFSITAAGNGPLAYQWRKNGTPITGAVARTYTIATTTAADAGNYTVVITDATGSLTSATATLNLFPAGFDLAGYYARNADVAAAYANDGYGAWLHFWNFGLGEGRQFDAQFIVDEYLQLNPDLRTSFGTDRQAALLHWLTYGKPVEDRIGRVPIGFNVPSYLSRYPDLQAAFGNLTPPAVRNATVWQHYLDWGVREGRSDGDFEAYNYLATNNDLAAIFANDVEAAALHWYFYGRREGRRIPGNFDVNGYRTRNPDVVVVWGNDKYGCWLHYRDVGVYEGRVYDDLFRVLEYRARYADVQAAYGNNLTGVLFHWLFYGKAEGRLGRNP